ncbi:MAG: type ISP restriction/modification enzyme [Candidatus Acidiferrum sp.]
MTALETYLTSLREIRSSGEAVDETSYYGALETFFNEICKTLKPKVRCVLQLKNRGAGSPDGGLFTEDQLKKRKVEERSLPQNPARGVIEIKPTSDDAWVTAEGEQVSRYWGKYRLVLVTNYRDFLIVGQDPSGKPVKLEPYRLASSEKEFWNAAAHPQKTAAAHDVTFTEYVRRVMLHAAPLAARVGGGNLKEAELALKAGWGHAGKGGITMPGKGKLLERDYSPVEHKAFLDGARALGLSGKDALEHLGEKTCDVYLNDMAYWSNIPSRVWDYTIGGYQVIKKWLSYREQPLLDRPLTKDEVRYVQEMARRIAAILLLEPALDANYESTKQHAFPWPQQ